MGTTCASDAHAWPFHVAFGCGGARIEIFGDASGTEVGEPFEVTTSDCFENVDTWELHID